MLKFKDNIHELNLMSYRYIHVQHLIRSYIIPVILIVGTYMMHLYCVNVCITIPHTSSTCAYSPQDARLGSQARECMRMTTAGSYLWTANHFLKRSCKCAYCPIYYSAKIVCIAFYMCSYKVINCQMLQFTMHLT